MQEMENRGGTTFFPRLPHQLLGSSEHARPEVFNAPYRSPADRTLVLSVWNHLGVTRIEAVIRQKTAVGSTTQPG